jgi:hypothetical protein
MKGVATIDKKTREKLETLQKQSNVFSMNAPAINSNKDNTRKVASDKSRPPKTIETMLRIASNNSQKLSDQADTKSHILISVNTLIVSVMLAVLAKQSKGEGALSIALIMQLAVSMATIGLAIMATRPTISKGLFTQSDLQQKKVNLLFFGNFYKMKFEDYAAGMFSVMRDSEVVYISLLRDIYCQGIVLGRKYKMLKHAYYVFMFGLIASVVAFLITLQFTHSSSPILSAPLNI